MSYYAAIRDHYGTELDMLCKWLSDHNIYADYVPGYRCYRSNGNYVRTHLRFHTNSDALAYALIVGCTILSEVPTT